MKRSLLPAVLIATLAVFLTGCSRNPVAPITGAQVAPGAGSSAVGVVNDDPPPVSGGGTPLSRVVTLTATDEGVLVVGRFTLYVRKNTLTMPATITMSVTDPEAMEVHFAVSPPEANAFKQSAVLTANLSDVHFEHLLFCLECQALVNQFVDVLDGLPRVNPSLAA